MSGKFEIYKDKAGEFRFRLKSAEGNNLLGSEGYKAKRSCVNGIESVKKNASNDTRYAKKESESGKFSFSIKAGNNQVIGTSSMYESAVDRDSGIASVKTSAPEATVDDISDK